MKSCSRLGDDLTDSKDLKLAHNKNEFADGLGSSSLLSANTAQASTATAAISAASHAIADVAVAIILAASGAAAVPADAAASAISGDATRGGLPETRSAQVPHRGL